MGNFDTFTSFMIILLAAALHGSFQLSISVLTLLSGHTIGRGSAQVRVRRMTFGFIAGSAVTTALLLAAGAFTLSLLLPASTPLMVWALCCGSLAGVGVAVWLFYYKHRDHGTSLWIPRPFAAYLSTRSKASRVSAEAFGLGLTSVVAELLFVFAPLLVAALVLIRLPAELQLIGVLLYTVISLLPLLIIGLMVASGRTLGAVQQWRESNKYFLQFSAGTGLLLLSVYVYVEKIVVTTVMAAGA